MDPTLELAQTLGAHALALSGLGALLVGGFAWALARGLAEVGTPSAAAVPTPSRAGWAIGLAWCLVLGAAAAFAALAEWLGPPGAASRLGELDAAVMAGVREGLPAAALWSVALVSHLGDFWFLLALGVAVFLLLWRQGRRALALSWSLALVGNGVLIRLFKGLFERTRPEHFHELAVVQGSSFPSGHTSAALVAYGWCAYLAWRLLPPVWRGRLVAGCAVLAWSIGCSRVLLQVHYPSDVLAGWLSGGAWCLASLLAVEAVRQRRRS